MLSYQEARELVMARVRKLAIAAHTARTEPLPLREALGRVLALDVVSDREYPPFDRSIRDGYAVRAADTREGAQLRLIGELKAGDTPSVAVTAGTCVQIMTGAALPSGATAVVMVEHTSRGVDNESGRGDGDNVVTLQRAVQPWQHVVRRGSEQTSGQLVIAAGTRLGFVELAAAAQVGAAEVAVTRKPRVAILSTGDEIVNFSETPGPFQIRNSNSVSLEVQVLLCGGEPLVLGNARDTLEDLRSKISAGLECDMLILSGGVSMGKYDLVEPVLREFGAEFVFDAVAIRPGKPVVFAVCAGKPVFGLPGNPVSTMVTFELFVRPAIEILCGAAPAPLPFFEAQLKSALAEKPGLTHFLPAKLTWEDDAAWVERVAWQGSGDVSAMSRANCLLVVGDNQDAIEAGERVRVLVRG
jgi:molybdopterin molybdotransferase